MDASRSFRVTELRASISLRVVRTRIFSLDNKSARAFDFTREVRGCEQARGGLGARAVQRTGHDDPRGPRVRCRVQRHHVGGGTRSSQAG